RRPPAPGNTTTPPLPPRHSDARAFMMTMYGFDIRDMTLASLRGQIGIVQQDVFLFGGSIRENIAYGRLGASDDAIADAARRAQLDG
ncbi:multidrug ABC transporter ATP-binding protein, partial [Mesorhizobium sp. WSM4887]|nr:multidrug ABC transporter ATP-binding protein [Mesorhizobium sp. WSM4887]